MKTLFKISDTFFSNLSYIYYSNSLMFETLESHLNTTLNCVLYYHA